jgi:hypothetical protein
MAHGRSDIWFRWIVFLALVVPAFLMPCSLIAESALPLPRIALFEPAGQKADATLAAILCTVADSVELSLACMQRYDVRRLAAADPSQELQKIRAYCEENRIDQAICGSGSARKGGGYLFRLVVYDRRTDSITISREGASTGVLDIFDVIDSLVASLLDGLSGTHLLFGSLAVQTEPPGAVVAVNGKDVGPAPVALRGLPVGELKISAHSEGREAAGASVTIADGEMAETTLTLARSKGKFAVEMPDDAVVRIRSSEIGEEMISGPGAEELPTGQYEVVATCPDLESVPEQITISRNETQAWMPWPNAYVMVESNPSGAAVFVDGTERGSSPVTVEVEAGKKHFVALKLAHYQDWSAEPEFPAARKQSMRAELSLLPGSLEVETSLPGASIQIDDGDSAETPHLFKAVPAGMHTIQISDLLRDRRYYTSDGTLTVEVKPGERSVLSVPLTPAKATLIVPGAPNGSVITIDGEKIDSQKASAEGVEVPAGVLDVEVTAPSLQKWKSIWRLTSGGARNLELTYMTWFLPHRTIQIDGKTDDWAGLLPVLSPESKYDIFPNQPGTQITKVYACRDDKTMYFRVDFSDGTPTGNLSKDINIQLKYILRVFVKDSNIISVDIGFDRRNGRWTALTIWNEVTRKWKNLTMPPSQNISYRMGNGTLEFGVPFAPYAQYVSDGAYDMEVVVASCDANGQWGGYATSYRRQIYFVP